MRWPRKGHMQWSKQMQGIRLQIEIMVGEAGRLFDYGQTATTKLCAMQKQHKTAKKLAAANEDSIPNETSMFETKSEGFVDPKKHLSRKVSPARNTWCSMWNGKRTVPDQSITDFESILVITGNKVDAQVDIPGDYLREFFKTGKLLFKLSKIV